MAAALNFPESVWKRLNQTLKRHWDRCWQGSQELWEHLVVRSTLSFCLEFLLSIQQDSEYESEDFASEIQRECPGRNRAEEKDFLGKKKKSEEGDRVAGRLNWQAWQLCPFLISKLLLYQPEWLSLAKWPRAWTSTLPLRWKSNRKEKKEKVKTSSFYVSDQVSFKMENNICTHRIMAWWDYVTSPWWWWGWGWVEIRICVLDTCKIF